MAFNEPVLLKRIPDDASKRRIIWYDDYVATGGYAALRKSLDLKSEDLIKITIESGLRGRGGAGFSAGQRSSRGCAGGAARGSRPGRSGRSFRRRRRGRITWRSTLTSRSRGRSRIGT
jgi:hypothetical protein